MIELLDDKNMLDDDANPFCILVAMSMLRNLISSGSRRAASPSKRYYKRFIQSRLRPSVTWLDFGKEVTKLTRFGLLLLWRTALLSEEFVVANIGFFMEYECKRA